MKINGTGVNKIINMYTKNTKVTEKKEVINKKDSLEISTIGKNLSTFSSDGDFGNTVAKIESIKKQISNGTYKSNSELTAKKILDNIKGREV